MTDATTNAPPRDLAQLLTLLQEQCTLYGRILELTGKQASFVRNEQPSQLLRLLVERQDLVRSLTKNNAQLEPYREQWAAVLESINESQRTAVKKLLDCIDALREKIRQRDEQDCASLAESKDRVARELGKLNRGGQAIGAYQAAAAASRSPRPTAAERSA